MTRDRLADGVARRAKPCCAPFFPHTDLPVESHILRPQRPSVQRGPKRLQPQQVRRNLQYNPLARCYETHMSKVLHEMGFKSDSLDQRLLSAWQHCASVTAVPSSSVAVGSQEIEGEQLKQQVHNMWAIRQSLRSAPSLHTADVQTQVEQLFAGWKQAPQPQSTVNITSGQGGGPGKKNPEN